MVKPILFYAQFSPAARAVLQTLHLLDVDVEVRLFDYARKENITEEFVRNAAPLLRFDFTPPTNHRPIRGTPFRR